MTESGRGGHRRRRRRDDRRRRVLVLAVAAGAAVGAGERRCGAEGQRREALWREWRGVGFAYGASEPPRVWLGSEAVGTAVLRSGQAASCSSCGSAAERCCAAHSYIATSGSVRLQPSGVNEYSTRVGTAGISRRRDEPVALERAQRLRQRLLGNLADLVEHLAVAPGARREQVEDVDAPLAGEQPEHRSRAMDHLDVVDFAVSACTVMCRRACAPSARRQQEPVIGRSPQPAIAIALIPVTRG